MKKDIYVIKQNKERYGDIAKKLPDVILVFNSKEEANNLAEMLSGCYPGCDYLFYVIDKEEVVA